MVSAETILALEQTARSQGSGIEAVSLAGVWRLQQTWTRDGHRPSPGTDPLLRSLGAQLSLQQSRDGWQIINQVSLGALLLRFEGPAMLRGSRPLLQFHFRHVELKLGSLQLLKRSIPEPPRQRLPFFALIATAPDGQWLTARGRGGGLALWMKAASPSR